MIQLTPMMEQYFGVKKQHPDALLFFRMGDFFELFYDDAKVAARVLGITLTSRAKGEGAVPMAGVPVRSVDAYLKKLIRAGQKVVVCDQIEDPRLAKGIVDRAVTRIVTAGTVTEDELLEDGEPNYLVAIMPAAHAIGVAYAELSTGHFLVELVPPSDLVEELLRRSPAEILLPESLERGELHARLRAALDGVPIVIEGEWTFDPHNAEELLREHFGVATLEGFGLDASAPYVAAAGAALRYLQATQRGRVANLRTLRLIEQRARMILSAATWRCLELLKTARDDRREGSLLWCLDRTATAGGARCLKEWLLHPLLDRPSIEQRLQAVRELGDDEPARAELRSLLANLADLERLASRVALKRAHARDLIGLRESLRRVPAIKALLQKRSALLLGSIEAELDALADVVAVLDRAIADDAPLALHDGGLIKRGYAPELDDLHALRTQGHTLLAEIQRREIERTGIATLKVGYNRVFGFYIEVTNAQNDRVPAHFIRKQTLKNAERYITPELKEHEAKVLSAEERGNGLECELFEQVRDEVAEHVTRLQHTAAKLSELDVLVALAVAAREHGLVEPEITDDDVIEIEEGRHPVLSVTLGRDRFVPNDCALGGDHARTYIITGPNMAGKSTYLRQVALISLLAQIGSFVPAKRARLGIVDRIFTRVGAADDLVKGASTFMVEMTETASILNNATRRSLVILDEVGRGTSTFDGLALAWAISEHLHRQIGAKTLFATHYHQLIALADAHAGVRNVSVAVKEYGHEIIFLHKIVAGGTDKSYGLHVARLAGVPEAVTLRGAEILKSLEDGTRIPAPARAADRRPQRRQLALFDLPQDKVLRALQSLDLDRLAPMDALLTLREWQGKLRGAAGPGAAH
ncbi:MAG: DNA mismatch repair protein MutS [Planctomycetota bacterium]